MKIRSPETRDTEVCVERALPEIRNPDRVCIPVSYLVIFMGVLLYLTWYIFLL